MSDARTCSVTEHRDLRTGRPIWLAKRRPSITTLPLDDSIACDVAVIGAGISGALIAENLSEAGLDIIILDRRSPVEGSTPASTALLQYELDTPLSLMAKRIGRTRAERLWRRSRLSVDALRERTERLGLDVDAETRGSIYLDGNILGPAALAIEAEARARGLRNRIDRTFRGRGTIWNSPASRHYRVWQLQRRPAAHGSGLPENRAGAWCPDLLARRGHRSASIGQPGHPANGEWP